MTSQEPRTPYSVDGDNPDTEVIVVSSPAPVFVDSTGRRRRLLRRLSYVFGGLCMVYGGLVSVSLAGGPVSSSVVLPLPDLRDDEPEEVAGPRPTPIPLPSVSARPLEAYGFDVAPRRRAADVNRVAEPRPSSPSVRTSAKPSASAAPTTVRPVESTPVPTVPTPVPSATSPVTVPPIKTPPPPAGPAPPPAVGGIGGGGEVPDETLKETETVAEPEVEPEPVVEPDAESDAETEAPETSESADTSEPSVAAEQTA